jgi:hypothetical protein
MAFAKYTEHFKKTIEQKERLPQQIFFRLQDRGCHKDMEEKAKQRNTNSFVAKSSLPSIMYSMSLYYAATFSQEHRHHSNKPHHTFFVCFWSP